MTLDPGPYLAAFRMLSDDFRTLGEYVELADPNLPVYSHRLYELLLRACTEFESACKELLVSSGHPKPAADMSVLDYRTLEPKLKAEGLEVGLLMWLPAHSYIRPFADWGSAEPPLAWYSDYNKVKHNRNTEFAKANLANVRLAIAAQFAILSVADVIPKNVMGFTERTTKHGKREIVYPGYAFSLVR